jgi:hypothetical protein
MKNFIISLIGLIAMVSCSKDSSTQKENSSKDSTAKKPILYNQCQELKTLKTEENRKIGCWKLVELNSLLDCPNINTLYPYFGEDRHPFSYICRNYINSLRMEMDLSKFILYSNSTQLTYSWQPDKYKYYSYFIKLKNSLEPEPKNTPQDELDNALLPEFDNAKLLTTGYVVFTKSNITTFMIELIKTDIQLYGGFYQNIQEYSPSTLADYKLTESGTNRIYFLDGFRGLFFVFEEDNEGQFVSDLTNNEGEYFNQQIYDVLDPKKPPISLTPGTNPFTLIKNEDEETAATDTAHAVK